MSTVLAHFKATLCAADTTASGNGACAPCFGSTAADRWDRRGTGPYGSDVASAVARLSKVYLLVVLIEYNVGGPEERSPQEPKTLGTCDPKF